MNRKSNIIYLEKETHSFFDTNLNPVKISKNDILITTIRARDLSKYQLNIKKSELSQKTNIADYLYARCIQEGFFQAQKSYIFSYIIEDKSSEFIYHIYAKTQEAAHSLPVLKDNLNKHEMNVSVYIPDIFLPMALEDQYRESGLFLFEDCLVFYHLGNLAYQVFIGHQDDINRALHYIQTVYSRKLSIIYSANNVPLNVDIQVCPLADLLKNPNPLGFLCLDYFQKQKNHDLPILQVAHDACFKKSKTFSMLLKIACVIALMLILPIGKIGYGFYINHHIKALQFQNDEILALINDSSKNSAAVFEETRTQNQLQNHLHSLQKIQTSYISRYQIIAEIAKRLKGKDIFVNNFYFASDVFENMQVLELDIVSESEQNLIQFMQDFSKTPLISVGSKPIVQNEKVFSNGIFKTDQNFATKIIWISNVL
ncbi:hypothetical protein [Helicobacter sp. 13S00482-2]|uniref:hypothetical protein n=1 Tax=Helicobacter sp. 13S00482-2 TaxID=1476200 RepID=UPI00117AA9B8|nr:hypothetical protein [Helicobacter sp. 13S00482-2]